MDTFQSPTPPDDPGRDTRWIAVDWGTSNVRAWALGPHDEVLDERRAGQGMGALAPDAFEPALLALVGPWLSAERPIDVLCCGMVGARQGWCDAGYAALPHAVAGVPSSVVAPVRDGRLRVRILAGVCQTSPADVMRGEETQIGGFLRDRADFGGTLCLPGTHTKWVRVRDGRIERFATCPSGELFALLSERSLLRHSLAGEGWDEACFAAAVHASLDDPASLLRSLFALRADGLLREVPGGCTRAGLSGTLLGAELAAVRDVLAEGEREVVVIGDTALAALYVRALAVLGREASVEDGAGLALAGLLGARRAIGSFAATEGSTP